MPAYEGIAILGFPRSGTTLLRRILDAHRDIACPGETYLLSACAKFLASHPVVGGVNVGVESGLVLLGMDSSDVIQRLRSLAFSLRLEHCQKAGKRLWAEKTAIDVFYLKNIERIFGDTLRFVCMSRHGLDVAVSVREWCERSETYPPELHPYIQRYPRPLEAFSRAWVDVEQDLQSFLVHHADNAIHIRYEDLVFSTEETMRRILAFLEVDWENELVERAFAKEPDGFGDWKAYGSTAMATESIGRWKKLSRTTLAELAPIVHSTLTMLGYDPVLTGQTVDAGEALRRYQWGLKLQQAHARPPSP